MGNLLSCCSCCPIDNNLDNLPDHIYHSHLFNYLHLDDIWNLRLVSKSFYKIVKSYQIEELCFFMFYLRKGNLFSTTKSIKFANHLDITKCSLLSKPSTNLINLKYLKIDGFKFFPIRLEDLNKFTKLQVLVIVGQIYSNSNDNLRLPDLKALQCEIVKNEHRESDKLIIDTPNLRSLRIDGSSDISSDILIEFVHPSSVKHLLINDYKKNLQVFSNLECLELNVGGENIFNIIDDLHKLKNLKAFKVGFCPVDIDCEVFDKLKHLFNSKNDHLQMVLHGVRIRKLETFDDYEGGLDFEFQQNNYDELEDDLHFVNVSYPEDIMRLSSSHYPPIDLFHKYTNIQQIYFDFVKEKDEHQFIKFIEQCRNLWAVSVTESSLSQQFYDQLPAVSLLTDLNIMDDVDLNFDFVMKMPYIYRLKANNDVLRSENLNLNDLKYLKALDIKVGSKEIEITKEGIDRYVFRNFRHLNLVRQDYFSLNELIEWIANVRNNEPVRFEI